MKNTMLRRSVSFIIWSVLSMASAYARTVPLVIVAAETVQNMAVNTAQVITYTVHNNVPSPVQLNMELSRTRVIPASPLASFQVTNDCVYRGLANYVPPRGDCDVSVIARSGSVAGAVHASLLINYGPTFQTIAPAPVLNFNVTGGGGDGGLFFTDAPTGQDMLFNSHQDIIWTLQNTTSSAIPLVPGGTNFTVASSLTGPPVFTNDCNNSVPGNGGICHIQALITSLSTAGHVSQYVYVTYNTSSKLVVDSPTSFNISGSSAGKRTFSMVNKCPYPVWFSFAAGGTSFFGCTTDASCDAMAGASPGTFTCNTSVLPSAQCFWKNPTASSYMLSPLTGTATVYLNEGLYTPTPSQPEEWSGTISGRTGCPTSDPANLKTACDTGDCGGTSLHTTGGCTTGISPPNIQAEPTLQANVDFYDITTINGINVPMSMEPINATRDATNPYTCGGAGIATSQTGTDGTIGGCAYNYSPPSPTSNYIWIDVAGASCTLTSECSTSAGEACGLSKADILGNLGTTHCGTWLGYWTPDEVCVLNSSYSQAPFSCTTSCVTADCSPPPTNYADLYGCNGGTVGAQSCYGVPPGTHDCCGCKDWNGYMGIQVPTLPVSGLICSGNNDGWTDNVLSKITWLKQACPSVYSYPHDDPTSSFTCSNSGTANSVNYRITYCPGGASGAPAGVTPDP